MKHDSKIFHDFFYASLTDSQKAKSNNHFDGPFFYSYSTVIGAKVPKANGKTALLISESSMSATTVAHLSTLRNSCPYDTTISVPFKWGDSFYSLEYCIDTLSRRFIDNLNSYKLESVVYAVHRRNFLRLYNSASMFSSCIHPLDLSPFDEIKSLADGSSEELRKLQGKRRAAKTAERKCKEAEAAEQKRLFELAYPDYLSRVSVAFFGAALTSAECQTARAALDPNRELSFVYPYDNELKTSRGVSFDRLDAVKLLAEWKAGRITEGMHIGLYIVRSMTDAFVQIGCHKIPVENLNALYEELKNKNQDHKNPKICS